MVLLSLEKERKGSQFGLLWAIGRDVDLFDSIGVGTPLNFFDKLELLLEYIIEA